MTPHEVLHNLLAGHTLSEQRSQEVFESIFSGHFDDAQIASFLTLLQQRGVTVPELTGAARAMRGHVTRVHIPTFADGIEPVVLDTCGTGGGTKTFNISTAAAFVVAAASPHHTGGSSRLLVAKHGNRSRTGRGSAEVLKALGVNVDAPPEIQTRCLAEAGVCFCFAIHHHPATRHATTARKSLGFPTIFNLIGPLTNPAFADRQLIGTYQTDKVELLARTLAALGAQSAMVVHGHSGLDEISTTGSTRIARVIAGKVEVTDIDVAALGVRRASLGELLAADVEHGAAIVRAVLDGQTGPARDIVAINAAAALVVAGAAVDWNQGLLQATEAIESGRARTALERLIDASNRG